MNTVLRKMIAQDVLPTTENCRRSFAAESLVRVRRGSLMSTDLTIGAVQRVRVTRPFNGQAMVYLHGFRQPFCACCFEDVKS